MLSSIHNNGDGRIAMKNAGAAILVSAMAMGTAVAQSEPVPLSALIEKLNELAEDKDWRNKTISELTLELKGVSETFVLTYPEAKATLVQGESAAPTLSVLANEGDCEYDPVNWAFIRDKGFYLIEFCDPNSETNLVKGDFHRLSTDAGSVGYFLKTLTFDCSVNTDYMELTNRARRKFCNDP
jgi:hypothetical protein